MTLSEIVLRDATIADVDALARLHVNAFKETHGGGPSVAIREAQWRALFDSSDDSWFCVVLATPAGELIGFAKGQPYAHVDLPNYNGELNKIYLLRAYHRRGLGRQLLCATARRLLSRGITSMLLFGDATSPTNGFYEAMGAERLFAPNGEFHGSYGWSDLTKLATLAQLKS